MTLQDSQQQREPVLIDTGRETLRMRRRAVRNQRLDFNE